MANNLIFIPAIVVTIGYFVICSSVGVYPFEKYLSLADIWSDRGNPVVIGRMAVFIVLAAYVIYWLYYMWRLEPLYTRYIKQTQSNEGFNLSWIRSYFVSISVIYFANVSIIIYLSPYSIPLYLLTAFVSYMFMIYFVASCRSFAPLEGLKIRFTLLKLIVEVEDYDYGKRCNAIKQFAQFEEWINSSKPYTLSNFSLHDVVAQFPSICTSDINIILQERGFKFQSYIRECRINYAAELIDKPECEMRLKELSFNVGFDSPASFSRAFKAVKGVSPKEYRDRTKPIR